VEIDETNVFERNAEALLKKGIRRALNEGGTASSKTWSIMQLLILIAQNAKRKLLISIVSESLPHLKRGCIRDFKSIMGDNFDDSKYNKSDHIYPFGLGTMEFFPADEPSKMRGGRRDILFINEANNVPYDGYKELDIRTRLFTFLDWNPVSEFWAHEHLLNKPENQYIHSTYLDALHVLPREVIANIESNKSDPNWWNIYGLGRIGKIEGLVYPHFEQIDKLPDRGDVIFGLDFGFSGDPASLTKNIITPQEIYSEELIYETNLTNADISARMTDLGLTKHYDLIGADSAEPKSIEELFRMGWDIKPVSKGPGSVEFGHQVVRQRKQYWTSDSLNCIKEQRNFRYIQDKMGRYTERTTHQFSHGMDSRRYAVMLITEPPEPQDAIITYDSMKLIEDIDL
jgi:phage terminase large subunit